MKVGDYDIPEDWESMSCIYNCGYLLVWERRLGGGDVGERMETHIAIEHTRDEFPLFNRLFKKGKNESE